jgi:alpha-1,3/alpha-1,6-mannosyltransferase
MSDKIVVNSEYTKKVFKESFNSIKTVPDVLYPPIDIHKEQVYNKEESVLKYLDFEENIIISSTNRYEEKKNIPLAIEAFKKVYERVDDEIKNKLFLVIGGGYDERVSENINVYQKLSNLAKEYSIEKKVIFLKNFNNSDRFLLFNHSTILLYTPENEHFGIVPIEAQLGGVCVVACNSGGPLESVINDKTGYLVNPDPESFSNAILKYLSLNKSEKQTMKNVNIFLIYKKTSIKHIKDKFSLDTFSKQLESYF